MIPANDFRRQWREAQLDLERAFTRVLESGWYILGEEVRAFEIELAAFWGLGYAAGVASGLDAIEISLKILGCKQGDESTDYAIVCFRDNSCNHQTGRRTGFH